MTAWLDGWAQKFNPSSDPYLTNPKTLKRDFDFSRIVLAIEGIGITAKRGVCKGLLL